ncbi:hypothetical protein [Prevotella histicola]|uniref:Uncharacterized protein n=1 Tax=Prevotella histicola F0411 TaxID=857291 RepID=G6AEP1_9BACT|nr:hypothetical protein [Prevotella histicola]EHG17240.1 hypothetical protein HMPREF9138_00568 [Prevotella histicola F0411]QUB83027.1 hypothetical protein J5A62_04155 [Prevotella histicola]
MTLIAYILRLLKVPFTNKNLRGIFWTHTDRDNLLGYARILSYYGIKINAKIIDSLDSIDKQELPYLYFGREKFIKHYCKKDKSKDSTKNYIILSHYKWFKNDHIGKTPTYILNGEKLPSGITILDIINAS